MIAPVELVVTRHQALAAEAAAVVQIPLAIPRDMEVRGRELTLDEVRALARAPVEYRVTIVAS